MTEHSFEGEFEGELYPWREDRPDSWLFVALPASLAQQIDESLTGPPRGFGSVRVEVTVGGSTWSTSIFPTKESYILPVKRPVRRAEGLELGDAATFTIRVLD